MSASPSGPARHGLSPRGPANASSSCDLHDGNPARPGSATSFDMSLVITQSEMSSYNREDASGTPPARQPFGGGAES